MGTLHEHNQPIADKQQLLGWLQSAMPQYKLTPRGPGVIIGNGTVTGLTAVPKGPGKIKTVWGMPSIGVQILMTLTIFAGLLPGLVLWLIVWSSISGNVKAIEQQFAQALAGGMQPAAAPGMEPAAAGMAPAIAPGSAVLVTWPDGTAYPATVDQVAPDQIHCTFSNGQQGWYPASSVRLAQP